MEKEIPRKETWYPKPLRGHGQSENELPGARKLEKHYNDGHASQRVNSLNNVFFTYTSS